MRLDPKSPVPSPPHPSVPSVCKVPESILNFMLYTENLGSPSPATPPSATAHPHCMSHYWFLGLPLRTVYQGTSAHPTSVGKGVSISPPLFDEVASEMPMSSLLCEDLALPSLGQRVTCFSGYGSKECRKTQGERARGRKACPD